MHTTDNSILMFLDLYCKRDLHDISITYESIFGVRLKIIPLEIKNTNERRDLCKIIVSALPIPRRHALKSVNNSHNVLMCTDISSRVLLGASYHRD